MEFTTIKLSCKTKNKLTSLGKKGMTYDEIIVNLLEEKSENDERG